jgi:glutamate-ammonia-ligase adenylyltransferase
MPATVLHLAASWPLPADPDAGARLLETFAAIGRAEARLARFPAGEALLRCLGGNSPYLGELAVRESATLRRFAAEGAEAAAAHAFAELAATPLQAAQPRIAAALRAAKRRIALVTALADIGGHWPLERVTAALSDLAEATLRLAVDHLLRTAHDAGELRLADPASPSPGCGYTVLGMGKLGARELNYSSDVDLVILFDPVGAPYHGRGGADRMGAFFTRMTRQLVSLMEARDADGYVFRTDLRLRPDPAATPPAIALPAAIAYYESMGQNWERAAMVKARPVAGDIALGNEFLAEIRPFVWRRHLDFAAIADIHAMKRRIDAHKGTALDAAAPPAERVAGHNLKLGEGGIREIEFLAQTLQLVWGGRDPGLRTPTTLGALRHLARAGHLPRRAVAEMAAAYRFLRRAEHRLQMVADRQTHSLPERMAELERFAVFMGYADATGFATALLRHLGRVRGRYAELFVELPAAPRAGMTPELPSAGPELAAALARMGFTNAQGVLATLEGWRGGRIRALRLPRSRELMEQMLPAVLAALARQPQPDAAFGRFDAFLSRQAAGVQILSLFQRNPALLDRVAAVLGAAPSLADHLARTPGSLDGLLSGEEPPPPARLLRARLADARLLEDAIGIVRRTVREEDFSISVATMEGRLDTDAAGVARSALADAALAALLPRVLADFATRYGRVRGGAMAVVALGKAGGKEMMAGSDLDLMLVYDHPEDVSESSGARRLPASEWFVRACHAFVGAVTAPGIDGPLYAVDMRLRPSGNKGPVAVPLAGFRRYHAADAWTWERMALTRARVIAGPPALRARVEAAIAEAIATAGPAPKILADAASMRARLARDLPANGPWDVKLRPGGLMEVEFIAQALQLVHARARPQLCSQTTRLALSRLAEAGFVPASEAALLIRADRIWRTVQGMLRITLGRGAPAELPEASARPLLRAAEAAGAGPVVDAAALRAKLDALAAEVRAIFIRRIGDTTGESSA